MITIQVGCGLKARVNARHLLRAEKTQGRAPILPSFHVESAGAIVVESVTAFKLAEKNIAMWCIG
jgi:hypothetical protein